MEGNCVALRHVPGLTLPMDDAYPLGMPGKIPPLVLKTHFLGKDTMPCLLI